MNLKDNIKATLDQATAIEFANGTAWYPNAHALALEISGGNLDAGAGVIAALSPRMTWIRNVMLARLAFETGLTGGALGANITKANRILDGEPSDIVLGGDKVRSFFSNIIDPLSDAVTIDAHAFDIAHGTKHGKDRPGIGKIMYRSLAQAYRDVANELDLAPAEVQSITWITHRRIHKITK